MLPNYLDIRVLSKKIIRDALIYLASLNPLSPYSQKIKKSWERVGRGREVAVIIAGGPSFTDDLAISLMENRGVASVFALNFYCNNKHSDVLVPDYYVISDPGHLSTTCSEIQGSNIRLKSYLKKEGINLCVPACGDWIEYGRPHLYFDDRECLLSKNISPFRPRGYPSNTAFKAVAIAKEMGFEEIYILGLDYNYPTKLVLSNENKIFLIDEHHYGEKYSDYSEVFSSVGHALNWWSFDYHFFSRLGAPNIKNVTENSLIDFFDRMSPRDFVERISR